MADSRMEAQIEAIINDTPYTDTVYSRVEAILQSMIDDTPYDDPTYSRLEELLLQWKEASAGGDITIESLSVTTNGTYTAPEKTAYSPVTVNVADIPAIIEPLSVTTNGTYTAGPNIDGYSPVTVSVSPNVNSKTITQNGVYTAALENLDGYSIVVVNIPSGAMIGVIDEEAIVGEGTIEE